MTITSISWSNIISDQDTVLGPTTPAGSLFQKLLPLRADILFPVSYLQSIKTTLEPIAFASALHLHFKTVPMQLVTTITPLQCLHFDMLILLSAPRSTRFAGLFCLTSASLHCSSLNSFTDTPHDGKQLPVALKKSHLLMTFLLLLWFLSTILSANNATNKVTYFLTVCPGAFSIWISFHNCYSIPQGHTISFLCIQVLLVHWQHLQTSSTPTFY